MPGGPGSTPRPWPPTGSLTSCANVTPGWRSRAAPRAGAGRPGHPRPHRPGLGQRHQRRPGAPAHPALDSAAGTARAGRQPRRPAAAHTTGRVHGLAFRVATALFGHRHRVGHRLGLAIEQAALAEAIAFTSGCGRCSTAGGWSGPTIPTRPPTCTGWWPPTAPRRCSPTCSSPPRRSRRRPGPAARARPGPRLPGRAGAGGGRARDQAGRPAHGGGRGHLGGRALAEVGLPLPVLRPEQALLLHLTSR